MGSFVPAPTCYRSPSGVGVSDCLVGDEEDVGFGRTGNWFAIEHWGVEPDIITIAKALTAGYMPLGAAIVRDDISEALEAFPDVHTFGGHAGAAVAALTAIEIYEREGLIERAREVGEQMLGPPARPRAARGRRRGPRPRAVGSGRLHQRSRDPHVLQRRRGPPHRRPRPRARPHRHPERRAIELAPRLDVPLEELEEGVDILDRADPQHLVDRHSEGRGSS